MIEDEEEDACEFRVHVTENEEDEAGLDATSKFLVDSSSEFM